MILKSVYVRFYKSFNYDYLRKFHRDVTPMPWETFRKDLWYPFVRVAIEEDITPIVGANESGKSQLLSAIEKGISGEHIAHEDFCRYSPHFKIEKGQMRRPDFGFEFTSLTSEDRQAIQDACGQTFPDGFTRVLFFRCNRDELAIYVPNDGEEMTPSPVKNAKALLARLPQPFRIAPDIALPDSVPLQYLIRRGKQEASTPIAAMSRTRRMSLFGDLVGHSDWFGTKQSVSTNAEAIATAFSPVFGTTTATPEGASERSLDLAYKLLCDVANVDPLAFSELNDAIRKEHDGYANGLIQRINNQLATKLNFPRWWAQDRDFNVMVSPRELDLAFTIRDRTGTDYSFSERSNGLKYFLSYFIQHLAHKPQSERPEILLMDEPDAFLSSQGQQDLLKIFDAFAKPLSGGPRRAVQVVYVTHSPFLIDKNYAKRIRVLEKGTGEEGSRVVRDASRNHYEPLRSAFGAFVAETTFIGHCNLMVEGLSDQVLIAGASVHLMARNAPSVERLDLNQLTIVPAGSASHIHYLTYLARGRDIERPAVIVLLDSDDSGNEARRQILRAKPKTKMKQEFILQIGELGAEGNSVAIVDGQPLTDIEDLIPVEVAVHAVRTYLKELCGAETATCERFGAAELTTELGKGATMFDAIETVVASLGSADLKVEKVGFARFVVEFVRTASADDAAVKAFEGNFRSLFRRLSRIQRDAVRDVAEDRISDRIERAKESFLRDNPSSARREQALVLFEEIESVLDESLESEEVQKLMQGLRREFELGSDITKPIENFSKFRDGLDQMKYSGRIATQD